MLEMIQLCKEDRQKYEIKWRLNQGKHSEERVGSDLGDMTWSLRWQPWSLQREQGGRQEAGSQAGPGGGKGESTVTQQQWRMCERGYKNKISKTWPMTGLRMKGNGGVRDNYAAPSQANCRNNKNNMRNGPLPVLLLKNNDGNLFSTYKLSVITISIDVKVKMKNFKNLFCISILNSYKKHSDLEHNMSFVLFEA